jgi:23S rRNA (guanosine2251-2'-O)-methyltransferase
MAAGVVYGRRAVLEALRGGVSIREIRLARGFQSSFRSEIEEAAAASGVPVNETSASNIDSVAGTKNHQGIVACLSGETFAYVDPEAILTIAREKEEPPLIALLDEITDPHNLGAMVRSAECAGFHGLILPRHQSAEINATVMKTSAGAAAHLAIAQVTNLVQTMRALKKEGIWFFGADAQGDRLYSEVEFTGPIGVVIGSEGRGLRRLVKAECDFLVRIPIKGRVQSLNASVAAGILFFEAARQRQR